MVTSRFQRVPLRKRACRQPRRPGGCLSGVDDPHSRHLDHLATHCYGEMGEGGDGVGLGVGVVGSHLWCYIG